jgi:hypothetical protein
MFNGQNEFFSSLLTAVNGPQNQPPAGNDKTHRLKRFALMIGFGEP